MNVHFSLTCERPLQNPLALAFCLKKPLTRVEAHYTKLQYFLNTYNFINLCTYYIIVVIGFDIMDDFADVSFTHRTLVSRHLGCLHHTRKAIGMWEQSRRILLQYRLSHYYGWALLTILSQYMRYVIADTPNQYFLGG